MTRPAEHPIITIERHAVAVTAAIWEIPDNAVVFVAIAPKKLKENATMQWIKSAVGMALMSCLAVACGCGSTGPDIANASPAVMAPGPAAAEEAGWTLAFRDAFERNELGKDWTVAEGKWTVENGCLRGSGILLTAKGHPPAAAVGFQRLEFDAVTDVRPIIFFPNKPKPKVVVSDMSCFVHAAPPREGTTPLTTGYFFQFGGFNNKRNQIRKEGATLLVDNEPRIRIVQDKVHRIVVENDRGRLRLFVDGQRVLAFKEKMSLIGPTHNRAGFYFYTAVKVDSVKLYVKALPNGLDTD